MKNKFFAIASTSILIFSGYLLVASAQNATSTPPSQITFPIAELGNCGSQVECRAYCNKQENIDACTAFAQAHNLITSDQAEQNKKFSTALKNGGPGGCTTADACKAYCDSTAHIAECLSFAQKNGLLNSDNIQHEQSLAQALKQGKGPGDCTSLSNCKTFCSQAQNSQTCADFAKQNNLMSTEDSQKLSKFNELVQAGQTPGGCQTSDTCEAYCQDTSHRQECANFAVTMGVLTQTQAAQFVSNATTTGPGGCDSLDSCKNFCEQQQNQQACSQFVQNHGLGDQHPGNPPSNSEKNPEQHLPVIATSTLPSAANKVISCLQQKLGDSVMTKLQDSAFRSTQDAQRAMQACGYHVIEPIQPVINHPTSSSSSILGNLPNIRGCLVQKLGTDNFDQFINGSDATKQQLMQAVQACSAQFPAVHDSPPGDSQPGSDHMNLPSGDFHPDSTSSVTHGDGPAPSSDHPDQTQVKGASTPLNLWQKIILFFSGN